MTVSNAPPFSPIVRIYPGGNPADASTWGVGYDISTSVRYPGSDGGQAITYSAGRPDEAATVDAGKMNLTLDDRGGDFSTANPNGPHYGLLRRGTPITLGMVSGEDSFNRTAVASGSWGTSTSGQTYTVAGTASRYSTDGDEGLWTIETTNVASNIYLDDAGALDVDVRFTARLPVVATGAPFVFSAIMRRSDNSNYLMGKCDFGLSGALTAIIARVGGDGTADLATSGALAITYAADDKIRIRAQADGASLRLKVWKPANPALPDADEPDAWSVTAEESSLSGSDAGIGFWRVSGNTNAGTIVMYADDLSVEAAEYVGSVIKWPVRWDKSGNNCWAPIEASGILRRLRQGVAALKSPLARQLPAYGPTGYWTLEDGSDATSFGSSVTGVPAAKKSGASVTPAADTTLAGALQSPTFADATAAIYGSTPLRQAGTGFAFMFLVKLNALPAAKTLVASFKGSGRVVTWNIYIDQLSNLTTEGVESDGTLLINDSTALGASALDWIAHQVEAEMVAGTVSWAHNWHQVGDADFLTHFGTYSSSVLPRVWSWQLGGYYSDLNAAAWSHVWIGENTLPFVDDTFSLVSNGYIGELASDRIARLCMEEGVPAIVEPGTSEALGPQRTGAFLDVLYSAADADYGILYEAGNGLGYRPIGARYNRGLSFLLSVAAGDIDEPPEPTDDDQRVRNDWTVSRDGGSSVQAIDQVHIDAEGRYADSATINVETDDVLPDHAGWRLFLGTRTDLRWPGLSLNFARQPTLIPAWRAAPAIFRLSVTTGLDQVAGSDPDVFAEGYECTLWPHGWTVDLNCSAAAPWDQAVLGTSLRLDAATNDDGTPTCTLNEALDTTETGIDVVSVAGFPVWAATAEINGTVIVIGGEEMTVSATTGAGSSQTLTVARSSNGIVKSHAAGAAVYLAQPTYLSL